MLSWLPFIICVVVSAGLVYMGRQDSNEVTTPSYVKNKDGGDGRIQYEIPTERRQ